MKQIFFLENFSNSSEQNFEKILKEKFSQKCSCIDERKNEDFYGFGDYSRVQVNFQDYDHPRRKKLPLNSRLT